MQQPTSNPSDVKEIMLKFSVLEFLVAGTWASSTYFQLLFMRQRGISDLQTGIMLALICSMSLCGRIVWPAVSDAMHRSKLPIYFLYAMSALFYLSVRLIPAEQTWICIVLFSLNTFMILPVATIVDAWFFRLMAGQEMTFGKVRSWFSFGICIIVFVNGLLVTAFGWDSIFLAYIVFALGVVILVATIQEAPFAGEVKKRFSFKPLLNNKNYVFILIWATLSMMACALIYNFVAVKCETITLKAYYYGICILIAGVFEMTAIAVSPRLLRHIRPKPLLTFSVLMFCIQGIIMAFGTQYWTMFFAMPFQGIGFGIFIFTVKYYIVMITPEELKASSQGIAEAFYYGGGGLLAGLLGGVILEAYNLKTVLLIGAGLVVVFALMLLFDQIGEHRRHLKE